MTTWRTIISSLYPELVELSRRLAATQSIPQGNRTALAEDALHDACVSLLSATSVPEQIRDCRSYAITVLHRAIWRAVARLRSTMTNGMDDVGDEVPAPHARAWDAIARDEALQEARAAAGDRLWPFLAARVDDPGVSAGEVAKRLGTSPGMVRLTWHEARRRVAEAREMEVA